MKSSFEKQDMSELVTVEIKSKNGEYNCLLHLSKTFIESEAILWG